jgi:putative Mg2+ transporter-C (MgtC) family protein
MTSMFEPLQWTDIGTRLALTVLVGLLIGYNRSEQGKAAGMRTTLMVCLAASVAMIQVNLLLPMAGRTSNSFVMSDPMRLPLGILTGVGFIGGGVILRRGSLVIGVTTAATLWLVTVIGLCIGGGQIELGLAATVLGLFALWVLQWIESALWREHRVRFSIEIDESALSEAEIRRRVSAAGLTITASHVSFDRASTRRKLMFEILVTRLSSNTATPGIIEDLAHENGVMKLDWDGALDAG